MQASKIRTRLGPALSWLAPSVAAACVGALVAGALEGWSAGVLGGVATAGFGALLAVPALLGASVVVRGLVAAWQPIAVDDTGAAPGLAGWLAVIGLGAIGLALAMFQSVWALSVNTAFKPNTLSFVEPAVAVVAALAIVAVARPAARGFAWIAGRLDARWQRRGHGSLLRPRRIFLAIAIAALLAGYVAWRWLVKPRLGPFDTSVAHAPAAGLFAMLVGHAVWHRRPRRLLRIAGAAVLVTLATALIVAHARPGLALEIWGDRPLAGVAIDRLFDTDVIRDRMSMTQFRPAAQPGAAHPDIVLITIDTVRADHTPPYGGQADMPALAELAARGVVFDWAFSPSNVTRRSIPSIVTGLSPDRVRGRVVGWALRVDPRHVLLAERLRAGGYDTAGFMCCEGFWGKDFHTGLERGLAHLEIDPDGPKLAHRARAWLDARERSPGGAPLFVWMHILEPHNWTKRSGEPRNDDERRRSYDRALAASDQMAREVIAAFARRAPDRMPIFIMTADHGEGLGEHGQPYHSTDLYNSQIRVPLVIQGPGIPAHRVTETASLTDLVPTVLELAGFVAPYGRALDGRSLADLARATRPSADDAGFAFAAMIKDRSNPGGLSAVIRGPWKLIDNHTHLELYDTRNDPSERSNVLAQHPDLVRDLRGLLEQREVMATVSPFD